MVLNVYRTHAGTAVTGYWDGAARRSFYSLMDGRNDIAVMCITSCGSMDLYISRDHIREHVPPKVVEEIKAAAHSFELSA